MISKIIPSNVKISIHLFNKKIKDLKEGHSFAKASKVSNGEFGMNFSEVHTITQDLKPNDAKKINLSKAIDHIEQIIIEEGEVFSFWHIVGKPSKNRGFVKSRSLVGGKLIGSYGGGLCQLSGLIYFLSLHCGLEIIERFNHSVDIYKEEDRYTPLGSDATVAYGYKDLRLKNNLGTPIKFGFVMNQDKITITLYALKQLPTNTVEFITTLQTKSSSEVKTMIDDKEFTTSTYKVV